MTNIDPRTPSWRPKDFRRPTEVSDTSEEEETEYYRKTRDYEVKLRLGDIEYGQDVAYYDDNQADLSSMTYLQQKQRETDPLLYRKDRKGRVIRDIDKEKLEKRREQRKKRFERKKEEKRNQRQLLNIQLQQRYLEDQDQDLEEIGLPSNFGRKHQNDIYSDEEVHNITKKVKVELDDVEKDKAAAEVEEDEFVGPMPCDGDYTNSDGTHESDYEEAREDIVKLSDIPSSNEVVMEGHGKAITDFDIDPSHTRLATGSLDYSVKLWDFSQMNESLSYYRTFEPVEAHPIFNVRFSLDGKTLLICAGNSQPKLMSREGRTTFECVKGDMYMSDMMNTHGHTTIVTECQWHPTNPAYFLSSSHDGTVRVWDIHGRLVGIDQQLGHRSLHKARSARNTKVAVESCTWAPNGHIIAGGCLDSSIQIWETEKGHSSHPILANYTAHRDGITCLKFFNDSNRLISRSKDNTVKIWDIRNFHRPVEVWEDLLNINYKTQVDLSPDERYIITGTSSVKNEGIGYLKIIDVNSKELAAQLSVCKGSVISVRWDKQFNQIYCGASDSNLHVFYDPKLSKGGVVECLKRKVKERKQLDMFLDKPIITPHSIPSMKGDHLTKSQKSNLLREDPIASHKPSETIFRPSREGTVTGLNTLTQYFLRSINAARRPEDDPREALLSYAQMTEENPEWVAPAYSKTQPKPIFDYTQDTQEERQYLQRNTVQKCKSCGLKFCTCSKRRTGNNPFMPPE